MKKMIWLTTGVVIFIVLIMPMILGLLIKFIPASDQPGYNGSKTLSIYGIRNVIQKFISKKENLTAIGTSIKNPNLNNKKEIKFELYDESNRLIRTVIFSGRNIPDGDFFRIVFEPIKDSKDKTYTFALSSPAAGAEDGIEVFAITSSTESIIDYVYDGKTHPGGVPLVTFHKPDNKRQVIREIYSNLFSRLLHLDSQRI